MLSTSTNVTVEVKPRFPPAVRAVAVFLSEGADLDVELRGLDLTTRRAVERLIRAEAIAGKMKELAFDITGAGEESPRRVYVVGVGPGAKVNPEKLRCAAGQLTRALRKHRIGSVAVLLSALEAITAVDAADAIVTGLLLAQFEFTQYKGSARRESNQRNDTTTPLRVVIVPAAGDADAVRSAVNRARAIADGQNVARTVASRPGNDINPATLASVAQQLAREVGLAVRVLDEKQMARLGMGGILAVGSGSANPPRLIVLEHRGHGTKGKGVAKRNASRSAVAAASSPLLIVGKAITFDTGGISIKPAEKMGEMVYDKCGAMAVLGMMYAVAKLKLPIHVVGILSSAENMPGSRAYRPGDILRMYNGVTVEVTNTDAEGRLVLGDALAWGVETYKPAAVVDLATLTGGCVVALGNTMAGVMGNSDTLMKELQAAADAAGEKIWRLPVGDDQREQIQSHHADIVNSAGRWASPLQGGAFLSHFIPRDDSVPWAHFDIAGVADTDKELPYYAKGATGWGVRTLVNWVTSRIAPVATHATPRAAGG